jgi:hypothetical protein
MQYHLFFFPKGLKKYDHEYDEQEQLACQNKIKAQKQQSYQQQENLEVQVESLLK